MTATTAKEPRIAKLRVEEAMHAGVLSCDWGTTLAEVAATMGRERVHCVVVEGGEETGQPAWGIVSDLDLVAAATVRDLDEQTAAGSAASPVVLVTPGETLERAAQLMTEHGTAHLVVVDPESRRPVGILSTLDIARQLGA